MAKICMEDVKEKEGIPGFVSIVSESSRHTKVSLCRGKVFLRAIHIPSYPAALRANNGMNVSNIITTYY